MLWSCVVSENEKSQIRKSLVRNVEGCRAGQCFHFMFLFKCICCYFYRYSSALSLAWTTDKQRQYTSSLGFVLFFRLFGTICICVVGYEGNATSSCKDTRARRIKDVSIHRRYLCHSTPSKVDCRGKHAKSGIKSKPHMNI